MFREQFKKKKLRKWLSLQGSTNGKHFKSFWMCTSVSIIVWKGQYGTVYAFTLIDIQVRVTRKHSL